VPALRYGSKPLPLDKPGSTSVEVGELEALAGVIDALPVDVPSAACLKDTSAYHNDFRLALRTTVESLEFWERNRDPGASVGVFNVLQGNTAQQAIAWVKAVRRFAFRRVAWGGPLRKNMAHVMRTLLRLPPDELALLEHIHFLGVADLDFTVLATSLQRAVTAHLGCPVRVTYDVSTPYQYGYRYLQAIQPGVRWETLTLNTAAGGGGQAR
jgi:hypothetical protein